MTAGDAFSVVMTTPAAQSLRRRVEAGEVLSFDGVSPGAQPFFAVLLSRLFPNRQIVVVTEGLRAQEIFQQDAETWTGPSAAPLFYPAWEVFPHESRLPHADVVSERLAALVALAGPAQDAARPMIVSSVTALLQKTLPRQHLTARLRVLRRGESWDPFSLIEWLEEQSYEAEVQVAEKGHVSMRGGILDFWPLTSPWPVRLEFFGDQLDSLRFFDPITQVSREEIAAVTIPPGGELGLLKKDKTAATASLLEYLPDNAIFLLCEPDILAAQADRYQAQVPPGDPFLIAWKQFREGMTRRGMVSVAVSQLESLLVEDVVVDGRRLDNPEALPFQSLEIFRPIGGQRPEPAIASAQRREFFQQLQRWTRQDYAVHLFCNNDGERQRFEEIWWEYGLGNPAALRMALGALSRGFLFEPAKLVVVTDAEIFGRYKVQRPRRLKSPHAPSSRSLLDINFSELEEGDYVVHLQHGIGRYLGLHVMPAAQGRHLASERAQVASSGEECLVIEFAPSDVGQSPPKLYVPISEAHLVSKYVGAGKARPPLNTLGGARWARTKAQAEAAVRDMAADMLSIQAARATQQGHRLPLRRRLAAGIRKQLPFRGNARPGPRHRRHQKGHGSRQAHGPFDLRRCRLRQNRGRHPRRLQSRPGRQASRRPRPHHRPGPAAFQHLRRAHGRIPPPHRVAFPLPQPPRAGSASSTTSPPAPSILSSAPIASCKATFVFKDLGLVVIDEEQRFGVLHKERFKQLRTLVDVLTLTATPIPRTLYLALAGARDMSTIETPPQDRLPVETIVTPYDERLIRDAILREINRGGQVFFLHNRVLDIDDVARRLRALAPEARIAVGHGQMHSDQLEEVMTTFVNGGSDVLLSTTIIESGLDIPNANTIIIDRADRFGLSDLYQLRGRVGRYKHQAYAYLLLPRHAGLLIDARKRLSAIKQYSSLGSGFKIAMRDLEIRGAGNLLGSEQSGHITAVGFELYCQLLKQSVSSLKGEKTPPRVPVQLRLDFLAMTAEEPAPAPPPPPPPAAAPAPQILVPREVPTAVSEPPPPAAKPARVRRKAVAGIPAGYIAEPQQRIEMSRKLAQAAGPAALLAWKAELRDRFGPPPAQVELLLLAADLKMRGGRARHHHHRNPGGKLMLTRHNDYLMVGGKFPRLRKTAPAARLNEIKKLVLAL